MFGHHLHQGGPFGGRRTLPLASEAKELMTYQSGIPFFFLCEADQKIRVNSPVEEPHVLAIFHEALAKSVPVTAGVLPGKTTVILNTRKDPAGAREFLKLEGGKVGTVDAMEIAMETGSRVNMVMMGAIAKAAGFFDWKAIEDAIQDAFGKKYPALMKGNLAALKRADRGTGLILRLASERPVHASFPVVVQGLQVRKAYQCDALERDLGPLPVEGSGAVTVRMSGFLATLRLVTG